METTEVAIAREALRLAFICRSGTRLDGREDGGPVAIFDAKSTFEQEKAELLLGIREEVQKNRTHEDELCMIVCEEILTHLAGEYFPSTWTPRPSAKEWYTIQ